MGYVDKMDFYGSIFWRYSALHYSTRRCIKPPFARALLIYYFLFGYTCAKKKTLFIFPFIELFLLLNIEVLALYRCILQSVLVTVDDKICDSSKVIKRFCEPLNLTRLQQR